jgi:hypothetical protein
MVGGAIYPADRGVLAFMHWPAGGDIAAFLAQDLTDRCVGALLMGQGILDGSPLRAPWDDKDGDASPGWKRVIATNVPGPGQVRLGTDPAADKGPGFAPVQPYGIPILGGDESCYDDGGGSPPASPLDNMHITAEEPFFRYRLPYLADYSQETGLKWTPSGVTGTETTAKEKARYFGVPPIVATGVTELDQAGDFSDFPGDNYAWQVARFRFRFDFPYTGGATDFEEHGTYFFVHFKREKDFEAFVRDGIMPDDATDGYEVYSAVPAFLPDPSIEATGNRVNEETSTTVFAPAGPAPDYGYKAAPYHVMRTNVFEEPDGFTIDPLDVSVSTATLVAADTMFVSGVPYYIPRDQGTGLSSSNLRVDVTVDNFWLNSYRTDDRALTGGTTAPALLSSPCPALIGLSPFAWTPGTFSTGTGAAGSFYTDSSFFIRNQRIEIPFTHLDGTGAFTDADGPVLADDLEITGASYPVIDFTGDISAVSFCTDARPRVYLRTPRGNSSLAPDDGIQPPNLGVGLGAGIAPTVNASTDNILFHSTSFDPVNVTGRYGNFRTVGAPPTVVYSNLVSSTRDDTDFFVDEVYRYAHPAGGVGPGAPLDALYGAGANAAIDGPGMGAWVGGPIETPVQVGWTPAPSVWQSVSWVQNDVHLASLVAAPFLQVSGQPDRNPRLREGQVYGVLPYGLCLYPHKDYSTGYDPVGPDYSSETGIKTWTRVLDTDRHWPAGQPFVKLRIDGLQLQDFAHAPGNVGSLAGTEGIAILVKVPGLTTWMDIGRVDGSGPSKQDALLDGAGCQVVGPDTFDAVEDVTQNVYCQVMVHVGPVANLYAMTGLHSPSGIAGVDLGKVPLLVQVRMDAQAASFNLEESYDPGTKTFTGLPDPSAAPGDVRGLMAIRVVA